MPGIVKSINVLMHLILTTTAIRGRYCCYLCFTDEELDFVTKKISRLIELMPAFFF